MAVFVLDGGLFVGRFERAKYSKKKSYWWYQRQHRAGEISTKEYKEGIAKAFKNDIAHFIFKMQSVDEIDKVIVCYDGIYGRRSRGKYYKNYKSHKSGIKAHKHKGHDVRILIEECGYDPMEIEPGWTGIYDEMKEADDLVAETVWDLKDGDERIIIMSEDRDMLQMLSWSDSIKVHNLKDLMDSESFEKSWDIAPSQYVDWKCLVGDVSDNIGGLMGWGAKKATNLLRKYGSISNFPEEQKTVFMPIDKEAISVILQEYRTENEHTLIYCRKNIVSPWQVLEEGSKYSPITYAHAMKLFKRMPQLEVHFERKSITEQTDLWKKIIQLPFKKEDGQQKSL